VNKFDIIIVSRFYAGTIMAELNKSWRIISVTSGFEQSIKSAIESAYEIRKLYKKVFVPTLQSKRFYKNKYYYYNEKLFPGYLFVECFDDDYDDLFSRIAVIPGILNLSHFKEIRRTDFIIPEDEMKNVFNVTFDKLDKYVNDEFKDLKVNQKIKIIEGPFANFEGIVTEINHSKTKETRLKVCSTFLTGGDITSIVVNASQVELI